jgi:Ca2+-binding RTX toxin-like protein
MRRLVALSILLVVLAPTSAHAAVGTSCSFDAGTATMTATIGSGDDVTLVRSGDEIWFNGSQCGTADVHNTDTINISAPDLTTTEALTISESGGGFQPGKTAEGDGSDEIEITVSMDEEPITIEGRPIDDEIYLGSTGADLLNDDGDREVTFSPDTHSTLNLLGGAGADELEIVAHDGTVDGGPGRDTLLAGISQPATYDGGAGRDVMSYPGSEGYVVRGTAADAATVDRLGATDTLVGLETVDGGDGSDAFIASDEGSHYVGNGGNDLFAGGAGRDLLVGGPGSDTFYPLGGDDTVRAGSGIDTLTMQDSPGRLTVDFDTGTVTGEGSDTFGLIERIVGSQHADLFQGDPRVAHIYTMDGHGGHDTVDLRAATRRQFVFTVPTYTFAVPSWVRFVVQDVRTIKGSPNRDRIEVGEVAGVELHAHFYGEGGGDTLIGGAHRDILEGGPGADHLNGQGGRDICHGGPGDDVVLNCEV